MPSGLTAPVQKGTITTLHDFAMRCARQMGALIMMRDEPMDAPIPEKFEPSDYHPRKIREADALLEELAALGPEGRREAWDEEWHKRMARYEEWSQKNEDTRLRYTAMLEKVEAWTPPTPDHEGLKRLMIEQLKESLDFDIHDPVRESIGSPDDYHAERVKRARRDIEYHTEEHRKEVERTNARNEWLRELRASLPTEDPTDG